MARLGVGLIGCGNISETYLRLVPLFADIALRGVADRDPAVAEARGTAFGVPAYDVDALLGRDEIDIVVNLTTPAAHFDVSRRGLEAGKHVYSEKPLTLTVAEGLALCDIAEAQGCRIGAAPDTFLGGAHQQARALVDEGGIGRIVAGTAHVMSAGMEHWHPDPAFFFKPGGGPILDLGPYYITNLVQLIGPVRRVAALSSAATPTRTVTSAPRRGEVIAVETPTTIHALLAFDGGATVTLTASWDVRAHRHTPMELYGTDGTLLVPDPNQFGGTLEWAGREGDLMPLAPDDHPFGQPNQTEDRANYRAAGLAEMAQAIQQDRPHRCSGALAVHVVEVMTAILKSGETGGFVDLTTGCDRPAPLSPGEARGLLAHA